MATKQTKAEFFGIKTEREFVERLAALGITGDFTAEQVRNIRNVAQDLIMLRPKTAAVDVAKEE